MKVYVGTQQHDWPYRYAAAKSGDGIQASAGYCDSQCDWRVAAATQSVERFVGYTCRVVQWQGHWIFIDGANVVVNQ